MHKPIKSTRAGSLISCRFLNSTTRLPPVPKDYGIEAYWNESKSLNPLAVYVVAIRMMYGLSLQEWSQPVDLVETGLLAVADLRHNAVIFTTDTNDEPHLTAGLCVQALYSTVLSMATRDPGFYDAKIYVTYKGEPIGRISITDIEHVEITMPLDILQNLSNQTIPSRTLDLHQPTHAHPRPKPTTPSSKPPISTPSRVPGPPSFPTGSLLDPNDSRFTIDYTYSTPVHTLPASDILSAALDGLAIVSPYDRNRPVGFITALSHNRNIVWHLGHSSIMGDLLLAEEISRTFLFVVLHLFLPGKKFAELWLECRYQGTVYADGYVVKFEGQKGLDVAVG